MCWRVAYKQIELKVALGDWPAIVHLDSGVLAAGAAIVVSDAASAPAAALAVTATQAPVRRIFEVSCSCLCLPAAGSWHCSRMLEPHE